ncbi:hypothetical protein [Shouchella shacheensis]|uniref:hypothetical protein n=1 Tax=Shouchella shacheensis TaxID=1649580 RepID=UPI00074033C6|nr:hypothetical protein [Shouchella shacheensis]
MEQTLGVNDIRCNFSKKERDSIDTSQAEEEGSANEREESTAYEPSDWLPRKSRGRKSGRGTNKKAKAKRTVFVLVVPLAVFATMFALLFGEEEQEEAMPVFTEQEEYDTPQTGLVLSSNEELEAEGLPFGAEVEVVAEGSTGYSLQGGEVIDEEHLYIPSEAEGATIGLAEVAQAMPEELVGIYSYVLSQIGEDIEEVKKWLVGFEEEETDAFGYRYIHYPHASFTFKCDEAGRIVAVLLEGIQTDALARDSAMMNAKTDGYTVHLNLLEGRASVMLAEQQ